ncbi:putative alpha,alpha-trehalose-phosphate synthase [Zancudomyces culisetae]|uniref:Putative alpha,alpha-trehalose-phosphate synthase n=1 Tax=Zancudomyces culisetae TaxID=1213189 RepID=A0A1R1PX35_ZANCU|nr:putative alpha,alpha-trehalose-phosphate synthase [Zancudomyces culisetae]|eukprot:OMH85494.1 putative alpha,alpha-trehalose-phosphate synthase [Zancudomyces culisetae]
MEAGYKLGSELSKINKEGTKIREMKPEEDKKSKGSEGVGRLLVVSVFTPYTTTFLQQEENMQKKNLNGVETGINGINIEHSSGKISQAATNSQNPKAKNIRPVSEECGSGYSARKVKNLRVHSDSKTKLNGEANYRSRRRSSFSSKHNERNNNLNHSGKGVSGGVRRFSDFFQRMIGLFSDEYSEPYGITDEGEKYIIERQNLSNLRLFNAVNSNLDLFEERLWVGGLGVSSEKWSDIKKQNIEDKLLDEFETIPVHLDDKEFDLHYNFFCKQLIWPLFHSIPPEMPQWKGWDPKAYEESVNVCQKFCNKLVKVYREGDIIWINDYHLMLLPKMLRERLPKAKIVYFNHIPFPTSELFRCLHVRKELLEGVLGSSLIGFQTYMHSRHFIQSCKYILHMDMSFAEMTLEKTGGNSVPKIIEIPVGIDIEQLKDERDSRATQIEETLLAAKYKDKLVIVSRDKNDFVKGVRNKMLAYEEFLAENPKYQKNTILVQLALATTEQNEEFVRISDVVDRINSKFGGIEHQPVKFLRQDIDQHKYLGLLKVADAMLVTPLRDGLNLTSHEFIVCQEKKNSPLIISEFVGSYGFLGGNGAITINPFNINSISKALFEALEMKKDKKTERWKLLYKQVELNSAKKYVSTILNEVNSCS